MTNVFATQEVVEPLVVSTVNVRVTQEILEPLAVGSPSARATQVAVEPVVVGTPAARATQVVGEPLVTAIRNARASQLVVEVLCLELPSVLPIYPTLAGLSFNVSWKPMFYNMKTETTDTGADIDLSLSPWPLHEFDLTYSFLRNGFWNDPLTYGGTEFKTLMGFFLAMQGTVGRFLFDNPDDDEVTAQEQFTTDGINSTFGPLVRTFGVADYSGTEPVGVVNTDEDFNVYLDGVLQSPTTYDLLTALPCNQQIKFHSTPTGGQVCTTDMSYYYYCKLPANTNTFEKFMKTLWLIQKVTLHTCRAGA